MSKRYCLSLALKNDPDLIRQYEEHHKKVWPEIIASIKDSGILSMEIYRLGTRLFMVMEASDDFLLKEKQQWTAVMKKCSNGKSLCGNTSSRLKKLHQERSGY